MVVEMSLMHASWRGRLASRSRRTFRCVEVRLLGPVTVVGDDGDERASTSGRLRALLASLALSGGRHLSHSDLVDLLWDTDPPAAARTTLHGYIHRRRSAAGPLVETR